MNQLYKTIAGSYAKKQAYVVQQVLPKWRMRTNETNFVSWTRAHALVSTCQIHTNQVTSPHLDITCSEDVENFRGGRINPMIQMVK